MSQFAQLANVFDVSLRYLIVTEGNIMIFVVRLVKSIPQRNTQFNSRLVWNEDCVVMIGGNVIPIYRYITYILFTVYILILNETKKSIEIILY